MTCSAGLIPPEVDLYACRNQTTFTAAIMFAQANAPFDLTGYSAALSIRQNVGDTGAPLLAITTSSPTVNGSSMIISAALGQILLTIEGEDLTLLPLNDPPDQPNAMVYEIGLVSPAVALAPTLRGAFYLQPGII